ncbi:monothiol glutaredoxin grx5 [Gonapodya sp. JEL0774]|nr:monothiol glutaredoxin grx5 [Gonapodya sp. JEL0774]
MYAWISITKFKTRTLPSASRTQITLARSTPVSARRGLAFTRGAGAAWSASRNQSEAKALSPSRMTVPSPFSSFLTKPQRRWISDDLKKWLDDEVKSTPVVLFMKGTPQRPQCGFSRALVQVLQEENIQPSKVRAYNVLEDQELREGIKEYSNWPTIPQLYVSGEFVGGADIVVSMHRSGELKDLLKSGGLLEEIAEEKAEGKE